MPEHRAMRNPVCQYDFTDADLRGHGCAIASDTWLAREATEGDATKGTSLTAYATKLRELAGMSLETFRARGTTMTELERAYEAAPGFAGRVAPQMRLMRGVNIRDTLLPILKANRTWASVAVNYGVIQDAGKGIGSFRGGHNVVIAEPSSTAVRVVDPLRRTLVTWPIDLLVKAMETFGSNPWLNGRGEAGVVEYAMTTLELRTKQRDDALDALANCRSSVESLAIRLRDQKAQTALAIEERDSARKAAQVAVTAADAVTAELVAAEAALKACREQPTPDCLPALKAARDNAAAELEAIAQKWRDEG
jgi:hypothetical protein